MKKILFLSVLSLSFLIFGNNVEAYGSTKQTAVRLNDEYSLFTITYTSNFLNRNAYLPIAAERGLSNENLNPVVGFELITDSGLRIKDGTTNAIVLSEANIKEDKYFTKQNEPGTYILVVLYKNPERKSDTALQITSLPFVFEKNNKRTTTKLNPHELVNYRTEAIN
jgi:hypothetical protein